ELARLRAALVQAPDRLTAGALQFLRAAGGAPDLLWLNCCAMHVAGHQFFDVGPLLGPNSRMRSTFERTRLDVAQGYDRMLGELLGALPPRSEVLVFFAKGMTAAHGWHDLLPNMLRRILGRPEAKEPIAVLRRLVPRSLRRFISDRLPEA